MKKKLVNPRKLFSVSHLNIYKDSLLTLFFKIISVAVKFYLISTIARRYGSEDYGAYVFAMSVFLLVNTIIRLGFDLYIQKFTIRALETHKAISLRVRFISVAVIPFLIGLLVSGVFLLLLKPFDTSLILRVVYLKEMVFYTSIYSFFWLLTYFFRGIDKGKTSVIILEVIQPLLNIIFIYLFPWCFGNVFPVKILVHSFGVSIIISILIYIINDKANLIKALSQFKIKDIKFQRDFVNSRGFLLVSMSGMMLAWTDTYVIAAFESDSNIGLYQIALKVSLFTLFPVSAMSIYFMNQLVKLRESKNKEAISHLLQSLTRILVFSTIAIVFLIAIFNEQILLFFGERFIKVRFTLFVLCLAYGIAAILGLYESVILMSEKKSYLSKLYIEMAILNTCLNIPLTYYFSIEGTAVGTLLTVVFGKTMQVRFVRKHQFNEAF